MKAEEVKDSTFFTFPVRLTFLDNRVEFWT